MKCRLFIVLLFSVCTFQLLAQRNKAAFGLSWSVMQTYQQRYDRPPAYNYSAGVFAAFNLTRRFGLGLALDAQTQNLNVIHIENCDPWGNFFAYPVNGQDKFNLIRMPFWLSINLNYYEDRPLQANLIIGYALGKLLNAEEKEAEYRLWGLVDNLHYGIMGIEFEHKLFDRVQLTLGGRLEFTNLYEDRYGAIHNFKIVMRLGLIGHSASSEMQK